MVVKHLVHKNIVNDANTNWNKLKCTPIGPFLQMTGIVPGNANDTANSCKSSEFSAQFNSSMIEHIHATSKLTDGMSIINDTLQNVRGVLYNIREEALKNLKTVFKQIFNIYIKIGNIFYVIVKHLVSILQIFKGTVGVGTAITSLLVDFINLIRYPINGIYDLIEFFTRGV
jgi:hypothetical protein